MEMEKEKFRSYLDKSGLTTRLMDLFVKLYEETEKPQDALDYLKKELGMDSRDQERLVELEMKVKTLEEENSKLKMLLQEYKSSEKIDSKQEEPEIIE